jgi:hypothetical protein
VTLRHNTLYIVAGMSVRDLFKLLAASIGHGTVARACLLKIEAMINKLIQMQSDASIRSRAAIVSYLLKVLLYCRGHQAFPPCLLPISFSRKRRCLLRGPYAWNYDRVFRMANGMNQLKMW